MDRKSHSDKDIAALDKMIEEITVDAYGDNEQLWAFRQVFEDNVILPVELAGDMTIINDELADLLLSIAFIYSPYCSSIHVR